MTITKHEKVLYGISAAVLLLIIIIFITVFRSLRKAPDSPYKELIEAKDETIRAKDETIAVKTEANRKLDETIANLMSADSALAAQYKTNQVIYKNIDAKLKDIPVRIARIAGNDDSIRAAFSR
jgi:hypothetical protein